jgi:hypothetical protein
MAPKLPDGSVIAAFSFCQDWSYYKICILSQKVSLAIVTLEINFNILTFSRATICLHNT